MIELDGLRFRDLDHDGVVAPYEDWRLPAEVRVDDLLARMTVGEKVGAVLHGTLPAAGGPLAAIGVGGGYDLDAIDTLLHDAHVTSFITRLSLPPARLAAQNNAVQERAAAGRLGIPVTISTDPRHHVSAVLGAGVDAAAFSLWPGPLGLGAIGDVELVRTFGDVVRQEYRAVGIHMALSPQADLATEPRWPRADGTFGSDPALVRALVGAYVAGVQGGPDGLTPSGVAAVVKHWVGYGAARDGFDGHNVYGRFSAFPGGRFDDHVDAFLDAFAAGVAGVMPTYNILEGVTVGGVPVEPIGAGFSTVLLQHLLRGTHRYDGLVVSDWAIVRDLNDAARTGVPDQQPADIAMPWGVEELTRIERFALGLTAGLDQFGGEQDPAPLLDAVSAGLVSEARLDESVRRVLLVKFRLGLFEDPFVDADAAAGVVGTASFVDAASAAQRRSVTVLRRGDTAPVPPGARVLVQGLAPDAFTAAGLTVTTDVDDATVAVVRLQAPFELLHQGFFFGRRQHEGDLGFEADAPVLVGLRELAVRLPTVVVVQLDRPAVLTDVLPHAGVVLVDFGVSDAALVDVLTGVAVAEGRLPFELPRDMASVLAHPCDRPGGLVEPLFALGHHA